MSETNEIVEKPPSEIPLPKPLGEENDVTDVSVNEAKRDSDISMLEDEEMPTYSTISNSTKPNNSTTNYNQRMNDVPMEKSRSQSPEPSEDQDNDDNESIYVVSSTADTERNFDDIDEEEGDYDSEEINDDDDDDEEDEDDDEDDEDEDDRGGYNRECFDRDSDDFEQDRFERASDDFVLRHKNNLKQYYKERSLSLQDLTATDARYSRRQNFSRHPYYEDQPIFKPNVYSSYALNSKPYQVIDKYENSESKVKRYIQNMKEQGRVYNVQSQAKVKDFKEDNCKQAAGGKQIKEYAKNVIQKLEQDELDENKVPKYATLKAVENVEKRESLKLPSKGISTDMHIPMEVEHSHIKKQSNNYKKINGIIDFDEESEITCTPIIKEDEVSARQTNEQLNGNELSKNVINLRTLSYEEYMRGTSQVDEENDVYVEDCGRGREERDDEEDSGNNDEEEDDDDAEVKSNEICLISPEKTSCDTIVSKQSCVNTSDSIKIKSIKSNFHDEISVYKDKNHIKMINQATETIKVDNSEFKKLQVTLTERNTQFESLKVAYQKTLQENLAMRQELDSLKKMLKKYEEYQNRETKSASIQTERFENLDSQNLNEMEKKDKNLSSTATSAASSIQQWTESGFSPSISIAPPDVRKAVNSDDSTVFEKTSKQPPHTLSQAFITSSRILRTLSNITQKKWNADSSFTQDQAAAAFSEGPSSSGTPLNSKKRKAAEMLGAPTIEQPFKIPHTSISARKKINQDSSNETSQMNGLSSQNENYSENRKNGDGAEKEEEVEGEEDPAKKDLGDNLKYYVYQDEENSKERSFLIQAEETGKIPSKGIVRECGPYLLGNLEVRMTEVNGTINIWGKEINVDSTEEEFNSSGKSADLKSSFCWQKTPQTNSLNNSYITSTSFNKKLKPQSHFNDSNVSKYSYFSDNSTPKYSAEMNNQSYCRRSSLIADDNCGSRPHRLSWSGCKHLMEEQKHAYHSGHSDLDCGRCNCINSVKRCDCHSYNRVQGCSENYRRHSFSGDSNKFPMENQCLNHSSHCSKTESEDAFKHKTGHCQSSYDKGEDFHHLSRQCHSSKELSHSCNAKNIALHSECRDHPSSGCCQDRNFTNQNEDHFNSTRQSLEQMEAQKRRLSGKKVRTLLMDLLKGCGDCRTPNPANISKPNIAGRDCKPEIIVTPCSPRASYSSQNQSMEKNRCCDTCSRRTEVTAEIEAQLEFFRIEMERVRSRSDALLDKLNMLKSADNN
ncbi:probable serine/threonine-protein kinase kinX [Leptopilina heterotoma]|uniref:probable serine/threonine-protein kinase kinX n=1 Tax=Leptopilina heterotoma TaxID=63436 RepID=UPI001CAA1C33|nr:probable serine/threonine-protein kinase kinX [Leptopilina heterotoma]